MISVLQMCLLLEKRKNLTTWKDHLSQLEFWWFYLKDFLAYLPGYKAAPDRNLRSEERRGLFAKLSTETASFKTISEATSQGTQAGEKWPKAHLMPC